MAIYLTTISEKIEQRVCMNFIISAELFYGNTLLFCIWALSLLLNRNVSSLILIRNVEVKCLSQ